MKKIFVVFTMFFIVATSVYAINLTNGNTGNESSNSFVRIPAPTEKEGIIDPETYVVGVGDQFIFEMLAERTSIIVPVMSSGDISIPGIATIYVSGMLLKDALNKIEEETGKYVNVSFYEVKKIRISVLGAVQKPGVYTFNAVSRVSDLLKYVSLKYLSKDYSVNIISMGDTNVVNIYDYYLKGDMSQNPFLQQGQIIYIPFAKPNEECVEVYGPVMARSFIPFIKGESLGDFYRRKIIMSDVMNYEEIMVIRGDQQILVSFAKMDDFIIQAGDKLEFIALEKIMVSGHVNKPGTYDFIPGHTVMDYISMAGGANYKGSANSALVIRDSKKIKDVKDLKIRRGDIVLVKRSAEDILIGEISILSFVSMIASIASTVITAFIAAGNI